MFSHHFMKSHCQGKYFHKQKGFTLIEMIVSLSLFATVVTISVGALLSLIRTNQTLQGEQAVMTNLAFALDGITRELRSGYNYYCIDDNNLDSYDNEGIGLNTQDCLTPRTGNLRYRGVSFFEGGASITGSANDRIMYYYDSDDKTMMRRVGNNPPQSIISSALILEEVDIRVSGSGRLVAVGNTIQPTVSFSLRATEIEDPNKEYRLQTTVTQRILDL